MKSITIHNLDSELSNAISNISKKTGLSQEEVVKKLLRKALNQSENKQPQQDFSTFCGIWTKEEIIEFNDAVKVFDEIDKEMWK